jgi:hypothetical protein
MGHQHDEWCGIDNLSTQIKEKLVGMYDIKHGARRQEMGSSNRDKGLISR